MLRGRPLVFVLALVVAGCGGSRSAAPPPGPGHLASHHCTMYNRSGSQYVTIYGPWAKAYLASSCRDFSRHFARGSSDFWSPFRGPHDYSAGAALVCAVISGRDAGDSAEADVYDQPGDRGGLDTCRRFEALGWRVAR